jgi:hypothetical protein
LHKDADCRTVASAYVSAMHASSLTEPGAFRMAMAVALTAAIAVSVGVLVAPIAGVAVAVIALVIGFAFETHHLID